MAKKLRHGQARVQFLANKAEILSLIQKGHSIKDVHEILVKNEKITMSYTALTSFLKKQEKSMVTKYQEPIKPKQQPMTSEKDRQHKVVKADNEPSFANIETIPVSYEEIHGVKEKKEDEKE